MRTSGHGRTEPRPHQPVKGHAMLRYVMTGLSIATLVGATVIPDEGLARGGRVGGAHVSGARVGVAGGRVAHVSRPIARPGVGYGRYAGYRRGVGWGVGAAAVGAAAAGAYYGSGYYDNNCYQDAYGQMICPNQYQYQYQYGYPYRY